MITSWLAKDAVAWERVKHCGWNESQISPIHSCNMPLTYPYEPRDANIRHVTILNRFAGQRAATRRRFLPFDIITHVLQHNPGTCVRPLHRTVDSWISNHRHINHHYHVTYHFDVTLQIMRCFIEYHVFITIERSVVMLLVLNASCHYLYRWFLRLSRER